MVNMGTLNQKKSCRRMESLLHSSRHQRLSAHHWDKNIFTTNNSTFLGEFQHHLSLHS
uniref:Uncharacterized protein n=1 Tax=Octopus bimaculoides TaxID=37653 RepID=A0A0L8HE37_OCTBM